MLHEFEIMLAAMRISNGKWYLNNANIAQEGGWHWLSPESQLQAPGTRGGDSQLKTCPQNSWETLG